MTKETRIVFGIEDLTAVRIECAECGGEAVHRLEGRYMPVPDACPWCNRQWRHPPQPGEDLVRMFLELLRSLPEQRDPSVLLRFELDGTFAEPESN